MKQLVKKYINRAGFEIAKSDSVSEIDTMGLVQKNAYFPNHGILDTSIGSKNLGDFIIMDSINSELHKLFDNQAYFTTFPTHLRVGKSDRELLSEKEFLFVCGTNLLNSRMDQDHQWNLQKQDWNYYHKRCVLVGTGWGKYDVEPTEGTKEMLKRILSDKVLHSVRDEYSKNMLNSIGITNVVNTCCPTTWNIIVDDNNIQKKELVVTTVTDYHQDLEKDSWMINHLLENYSEVHIWIQSIEDLGYLERMDLNDRSRLKYIAPSLNAYTEFLDRNFEKLDYIGTRLHAGIFAMQRNIRSLIIGIDNRALEIAKDVKINVVRRESIEDINSFIINPTANQISLPHAQIENWKKSILNHRVV